MSLPPAVGRARVGSLLLLLALAPACDSEAEPPTEPPAGPDPPEAPQEPDAPRGPVVDGIRLRIITEALTDPVHLVTPAGDDRLFIAERRGTIRIIDDGALLEDPFLDISLRVETGGVEQGLLGLAFAPDFETSGELYVNYTGRDDATRIERYVVADDGTVDPLAETLILSVAQPRKFHNGGLLVFGPDGMLWIGMGDGGDRFNAPDPGTLLGKMLRIDVGGEAPYTVPGDNPFIADPAARDEIWASGLRNPWRFSFDAETARLLIADVGADLWEEVDDVPLDQAGADFGWPFIEGPECVAANPDQCDPDAIDPVYAYDHDEGCSIIGGHLYRGEALPSLEGRYLFGDLCASWIRSFDPEDPAATVETWDFGDIGNILSFGLDGSGELYVLTTDAVYRIEPA